MKHSHSNNNGKLGRAILIAVLVALFILFIALAAVGIFGTKEQFARAKDLLPIVVSLITPLMTAIIAVYMPKKA
jgi:hypothetical protein